MVTPMISVPPKANITTAKDRTRPRTPLGMNPPLLHRFETPASPLPPKPKTMIARPARIIAMMATTLAKESQNSSSPKTLTLNRFIAPMMPTAARSQIHRGTSGNQKLM